MKSLRFLLQRTGALEPDLEGISQKVLTDSLRQMMDDGLVYRHDYQEMPPRVDYSLVEQSTVFAYFRYNSKRLHYSSTSIPLRICSTERDFGSTLFSIMPTSRVRMPEITK